MYKLLTSILFVSLICNSSFSQFKGAYKSSNFLFGPYFSMGLSTGSIDVFPKNVISKNIGPSVRFGASAHKFLNISNAFGFGISIAQNSWIARTKDTSSLSPYNEKYRFKEQYFLLPLEFTHFFSPYQSRFFASFQFLPGFTTVKNLEYQGTRNDDSTTSTIFPQIKNYHRFTYGIGFSLGNDYDIDLHNTLRFYLNTQWQNFAGINRGSSNTLSFFIGFQYFISL